MPLRKVLSDYELMEFFKFVLRHGFDTKSLESDYWEEFLSLLDVSKIYIYICKSFRFIIIVIMIIYRFGV